MEERRATLLKGQLVLASDEGTVGLNIYCIEVNKFSSIHTVGVVLCPASLSHAEKESGEMCIQFWFHGPRCWHGQSDCRTVLTSLALFEKDFNTNLKGPRGGQSVRHSASDR